MKARICSQCACGVYDPTLWMRQVTLGWGNTLLCANTPEAPGRLRLVCPGGTCRNFVVKHEPSRRSPTPEGQTSDTRLDRKSVV